MNDHIRELRRTLKSDGRIPSIAAVQEHLYVESRMKRLLVAEKVALEIMAGFIALAKA